MSDPDIQILDDYLMEISISDKLLLVRKSSRAKRLIFKSSLQKGVEIVIPRKVKISWVEEMIQEKASWIKQSVEKVRDGRKQLTPNQVYFKALDENWNVRYVCANKAVKRVVEDSGFSITVAKDSTDLFYHTRNLQSWFQQKARNSLIPWLQVLSDGRGLAFNRAYIKNQVSRWGSCSPKRNINLNRNLLFVSTQLVDYVIHHELTHLQHMDHSKIFWDAFSKILPDCQKLKHDLNSYNMDDIPLWASPGLKDI